MYIQRTLYSRIVDVLSNIVLNIIIILFFYGVLDFTFNVEKNTEYLIFIIAIILGVFLSSYIMNLYYKKQPPKVQIENSIIVYSLIKKKHIKIQDIEIIESTDSWLFMSSKVFIIKTEKNSILLNSNRYRNLDKFILELKKEISY